MDITKKWLETCGDFSLEGAIYERGFQIPQRVTLRFEQERVGSSGPGLLLLPDFAPVALVRSLLGLVAKGYSFDIETYFTQEAG